MRRRPDLHLVDPADTAAEPVAVPSHPVFGTSPDPDDGPDSDTPGYDGHVATEGPSSDDPDVTPPTPDRVVVALPVRPHPTPSPEEAS